MTPSNYSCPACDAKLLKRQRSEPAKPGEQAFCPHCMAQLPARDGPYTLGYELVEAPPRSIAETQKASLRVCEFVISSNSSVRHSRLFQQNCLSSDLSRTSVGRRATFEMGPMTGTSRFVVNRVRSRPRTILMAHDNIFGCQRPTVSGSYNRNANIAGEGYIKQNSIVTAQYSHVDGRLTELQVA